jgi:hypothetical protein
MTKKAVGHSRGMTRNRILPISSIRETRAPLTFLQSCLPSVFVAFSDPNVVLLFVQFLPECLVLNFPLSILQGMLQVVGHRGVFDWSYSLSIPPNFGSHPASPPLGPALFLGGVPRPIHFPHVSVAHQIGGRPSLPPKSSLNFIRRHQRNHSSSAACTTNHHGRRLSSAALQDNAFA